MSSRWRRPRITLLGLACALLAVFVFGYLGWDLGSTRQERTAANAELARFYGELEQGMSKAQVEGLTKQYPRLTFHEGHSDWVVVSGVGGLNAGLIWQVSLQFEDGEHLSAGRVGSLDSSYHHPPGGPADIGTFKER